ncbi:nickel transporter permease [Paenibacillus sp. 1P03SA]|uniref:nickel transporter permease n=1 Tax=Paenibacillus sp. 1P03SA TaxID=3132294 RepID=UPI0039A37545
MNGRIADSTAFAPNTPWNRLRRNRMACAGLLLIALFLLLALFGGWLAPHDPLLISMPERLKPPSLQYPLGTDHLGRCVLSRLLAGASVTLGLSFLVVTVVMLIGIPIGILSGYRGGRTDSYFMRLADAAAALPEFLLAVTVTGFLGPGLMKVMLAISCVKWIGYARVVRGTVMSEKKQDYILASIVAGSTAWAVNRRHLIRHIASPLAVLAALDVGRTILLISALSYLGLGVQPPAPEWGAMLSEGRPYFQAAPQLMIYPGVTILAVVIALNLLSEGLRDALDVQSDRHSNSKRRHS